APYRKGQVLHSVFAAAQLFVETGGIKSSYELQKLVSRHLSESRGVSVNIFYTLVQSTQKTVFAITYDKTHRDNKYIR
ncbi:MAG: hypothetical protein ACTH41_08885, partial [Lactococcus cremoris]